MKMKTSNLSFCVRGFRKILKSCIFQEANHASPLLINSYITITSNTISL